MQNQDVLLSKENGIGIVTLNRPEARNAVTPRLRDQLAASLQDCQNDPNVRVVILTGAGGAFCAGGDVKYLLASAEAGQGEKRFALLNARNNIPTILQSMDKPTIAAINGAAVGWGMDLALLCDIRIAGENAKFSEAFVKRGLCPDNGATWTLPRIVGWEKACELVFTGDLLDGKQAKEAGIVGTVVPDDQVMSTALDLARRIAANAPLAVRMSKRLMTDGLRMDLDSNIDQMLTSVALLFETEDHKEGLRAFFEKREAVFRGE